MSPKMKKLVVGNNEFEIVDDDARESISKLASHGGLNVADFTDGEELSNSNIASAITAALAQSRTIYIPAGRFTFNVTISTDCTIIMDDACYIATASATPCITAQNCSIKIYGGNAFAGANDDARIPVFWGTTHTLNTGIITLSNCHDCIIRDLKCAWSKHASVIRIINCINVVVENCSFANVLLTAISIQNHNENICVRNCSFTNMDMITGEDYCYAVSTGATSFSTSFVPIDGLIYENNYVYDSEDCGLDTHGASNVIIRNNRILQTVGAITAYNDDRRIKRPEGWSMRNILIENNYCETDKDNPDGREYPHAFVFLGGANQHADTEAGYENNAGSFYSYCDCIVQNNFFKSPNTYQGLIYLNVVSRNVLIQNNVFDCMNSARPLNPIRSINIQIINNSILNCDRTILFTSCYGKVANNAGVRYDVKLDSFCYVDGCVGGEDGPASVLVKLGQFFFHYDNGEPYVCTSYGLRFRPSARALPNSVTINVGNDGIATLVKHDFIPDLQLRLNNGSYAFVKDVLDMSHFVLVIGDGTPVTSGTYTAAFLRAGAFNMA